jgi:hypothetical protein
MISALAALVLGAGGCQGTRNTLVDEAPRARSTQSQGFDPQGVEKIAVLVRDNADLYYRRKEGLRRQVEDAFEQATARKGYRLATRSQVEAIKEEIGFQSDSPWTADGGAEPGDLYNVTALLIASINEANEIDKPSRASRVPDPDRDGFFSKLLDNILDSAPRETHYSEANVSADLISVREGEVLWSGSYTGAVQIDEDQPKSKAVPAVSEVVARSLPAR